MSRVEEAGLHAATVPGRTALPEPGGDPSGLRRAAGSLERAAARAGSTATVRGTLASGLDAVWTGEAATAACAEADELGRRSRLVVEGLSPTARALRSYAAALERAVARIRSLQHRWDELDVERELACRRLDAVPDPTGAVRVLGAERARAEQELGCARLSRSYDLVIDELRASGRRCARLVAGVTDLAFPSAVSPTGAAVRSAVTGGLWFADGVIGSRASRDDALSDTILVRRALAASAASGAPLDDAAVAQLGTRIHARADDPVYAQALLSELGADGLSQLLMAAGVAQGRSGVHVDTVRDLLGGLGSLVLTATSHSAPAGTDPRTRRQLSSGAALLADDLVAGVGVVRQGPGGGRATGAWLLGQLLSGARAGGDDRRLPPRLARRAAAAAATAEIAETRDADTALRHGTTLLADGGDTFASWFDDAPGTGDALHVLVGHVGGDPAEEAALLAEPLPDSSVAGTGLANSRGDRLTLGEHLVRRWITVEASGTASHPGLRLSTDADLARLLPSVSEAATHGAAETRARLMLELSRTSAHAMREASTTQIYTSATAPIEGQVADWLCAMRENVNHALSQRDPVVTANLPYAVPTSSGTQPWLAGAELTGVVGALAADTGMGLQAKDPGAPYTRLMDSELQAAEASVEAGGDVRADVTRIGFFDQAASAELVALARRQDELNRSVLQGLAEAGHVVADIRGGSLIGLASTVKTYLDGGTTRTPADDLVISIVRSDVELAQTERDDSRRAELVARLAAVTGGATDVRSALATGARRGPVLPSADALRAARSAEIRAAWAALRDESAQRFGESVVDGLKDRAHAPDRLGASADRGLRLPQLERLPRGKSRGVHTVTDAKAMQALFDQLTEGATRRDLPHYDGDWFERPDGVQVGMRSRSLSGGATIDVRYPDHQIRKVHIQ